MPLLDRMSKLNIDAIHAVRIAVFGTVLDIDCSGIE